MISTKNVSWKLMDRVTHWQPAEIGEALVGLYYGTRIISGKYGLYRTNVVHTDDGDYYVTGAVADNLFDGLPGHGFLVRVEYMGVVDTESGRARKDFALYREE